MKQITDRMANLLERLAEMFPKQHYQSELDLYIASKFPKNPADVEHYTKEYENRTQGRFL